MPRGRKGDDPIELEDEDIVAGDELALPADERLPWLESDDEEERPGVDTGRIVAYRSPGGAGVRLDGATASAGR